jgi:hypothetical protein
MSLEDLGNIGEFVAAVAVVISLIYLAVQIRQNTESLHAATFQDIIREGNVFLRDLSVHPELARIWRSGLDSLESLSADDRARFHYLILSFYRRVENVYQQSRRRLMHDDDTRGPLASSFDALARPGARAWWEANAFRFSPVMQEYVRERLAEKGTSEPTEPLEHRDAESEVPR